MLPTDLVIVAPALWNDPARSLDNTAMRAGAGVASTADGTDSDPQFANQHAALETLLHNDSIVTAISDNSNIAQHKGRYGSRIHPALIGTACFAAGCVATLLLSQLSGTRTQTDYRQISGTTR